jgi:hypothetical protein
LLSCSVWREASYLVKRLGGVASGLSSTLSMLNVGTTYEQITNMGCSSSKSATTVVVSLRITIPFMKFLSEIVVRPSRLSFCSVMIDDSRLPCLSQLHPSPSQCWRVVVVAIMIE